MKVNDIDISQYNAIQSSVQIESSEFQSTYFWNDGALSPFFLQKKAKIKKNTVAVCGKGNRQGCNRIEYEPDTGKDECTGGLSV